MKDSLVDIMKEIADETIPVLTEVVEESIKPLIKYRADLEKKLGNQAIAEMYKLEESES